MLQSVRNLSITNWQIFIFVIFVEAVFPPPQSPQSFIRHQKLQMMPVGVVEVDAVRVVFAAVDFDAGGF